MVATTPSRAPRTKLNSETSDAAFFILLVGPNLLLLAIFSFWPLLYNGYLSFVRWDMLAPAKRWVGFANYHYALTSPEFHTVLRNTFLFVGAAVVLICAIGLLFALLLDQRLHGRNAARGILFSPVMLSGAAIGIVWIYIFDPHVGLLNVFISALGLTSPNWLLDTAWALPAVIIVHVWKNVGFALVVFLAGLQTIPRELLEAAVVDGASAFQRFRHVTVPGLRPVFFFLILTTALTAFHSFDIIKVMTDGGPVDATTTLIVNLYNEGFVGFNAGRAGVASVVLFVLMLAFALVQFRFSD